MLMKNPKQWTRHLFSPDGTAGSGEGTTPPADTTPSNADGTLSQADVNKLVGKARQEGKAVALKDILAELGLDSPDALKSLVTDAKAKREAEMSEAQKLQAQLEAERKAKAEVEARVLALQQATVMERKSQAFLRGASASGVKQADDLLILIQAKHGEKFNAVFSEDGAPDDAKLKAFLKEMQTAFPSFFGPQGAGSPSNAGGVAPSTKAVGEQNARAQIEKRHRF